MRTLATAWGEGRNHFNAIRLVAAWLVLYGHAWAITGTPGGDLLAQATRFKFAGGIAVDMFFVISGFLIASSLERNTLRGYLAARAFRILPALVACVAVSAFVLGPVLTVAPDYWGDATTWRYFWSNASLYRAEYFLPGVFEGLPQHAANGSLWTLPIEASLYVALLIAGVLGLLHTRRFVLPWALALVGAVALAGLRAPLPDWLASQLWCICFFVTGSAAWVYRAHVRLSWIIVAALLALAAVARGTSWFWLPYFALVCYGTLWLAFIPKGPRIAHHDLSYGLYLYAWPVAQCVQLVSPGTPLHNVLWATPITLACAALSWFLIERPALRWKRWFGTRTPVASPLRATA